MNRIVAVSQDVETLAYRPRRYLLSSAFGNELTSGLPNLQVGVFRVITDDVFFERAFFYGVQGTGLDGAPIVRNAQSVWIADRDARYGIYWLTEEVTNDPGAPLLVQAVLGTKLNFKDFVMRILAPGDGLIIKYQ